MQAKTRIKNELMVRDRYKSPLKLAGEFNEGLRREKEEQKDTIHMLRQTIAYEMPKTTKEKIDATIFRRIYEQQIKDREPDDPELTLKPDMSRTLKHQKIRTYYHNGKWQANALDQTESWSCCMNGGKDSAGCVAVVRDKQKWQLSSYT